MSTKKTFLGANNYVEFDKVENFRRCLKFEFVFVEKVESSSEQKNQGQNLEYV